MGTIRGHRVCVGSPEPAVRAPRERTAMNAEGLKVRMEASLGAVDPKIAEHVEATLQYGIATVREEYTGFYKANRAKLDHFIHRVTILLIALVIGLLVMGGESLNLQI